MPKLNNLSNGAKVCNKCRSEKSLSEFYYHDRGRPDTYSASCRKCVSNYNKENVDNIKLPCPQCGIMISRKSKLCRSCYHKSSEGLSNHKKISQMRTALKKDKLCIDCGIKISRQSKRCMKCKSKGSNNSNWKEGASSLKKRIISSFEYRQWRSDVFKRDNYTCLECGIRGVYLHAHHIIRFSSIIEKYGINTLNQAMDCSELWDINNGTTLCMLCHNNLHKKEGYFYEYSK